MKNKIKEFENREYDMLKHYIELFGEDNNVTKKQRTRWAAIYDLIKELEI